MKSIRLFSTVLSDSRLNFLKEKWTVLTYIVFLSTGFLVELKSERSSVVR